MASYWSIDIVLNFFLADYINDSWQTNVAKLVSHYTKTWMIPDGTIVFFQWVFLIGWNGMDLSVVSRLFRLLRYLRLVRAMRTMPRFVSLLENFGANPAS